MTLSVLLDQDTGYFTNEVEQQLEYIGTDLLVIDRVALDSEWRGFGLGPALAAEAINRLAPGCRAVTCSPGISEGENGWKPDEDELSRVIARITAAGKGAASPYSRTTSTSSTPLRSSPTSGGLPS